MERDSRQLELLLREFQEHAPAPLAHRRYVGPNRWPTAGAAWPSEVSAASQVIMGMCRMITETIDTCQMPTRVEPAEPPADLAAPAEAGWDHQYRPARDGANLDDLTAALLANLEE